VYFEHLILLYQSELLVCELDIGLFALHNGGQLLLMFVDVLRKLQLLDLVGSRSKLITINLPL
jgi:hypothetical protein